MKISFSNGNEVKTYKCSSGTILESLKDKIEVLQ